MTLPYLEQIFPDAGIDPPIFIANFKYWEDKDILVEISGNSIFTPIEDGYTLSGSDGNTTIVQLNNPLPGYQLKIKRVSSPVQRQLLAVGDQQSLQTIVGVSNTGGGSAVTSVAGKTGTVLLDAADIAETTSKKWFLDTERTKLASLEQPPVTSVAGRIGDVTISKSDVGLSNVDNLSRAGILDSASLTGVPTAPTANVSTNNTQIATTGFVNNVLLNTLSSPNYLSKRKTFGLLGIVEGLGSSQSAAITSALAALSPGDYVNGLNKTYRIDTATQIPNGVIIEDVNFDITGSAINIYPLQLTGSIGAGIAVSTSLSKGVYQITVGSTAGYARGNDVLFVRTGYAAGAGFGFDNVADTWWTTVDTVVNSTTLILREAYPHSWSMPTSPGTLTMYKPAMMVGNRLINVSAQRTGAPTDFTHFFKAEYFRDILIQGGTVNGPRESAFALIRGRNWRVRDIRTIGQNQEGLGYSVVPVNGNEDWIIENNMLEDCRHGVSVGGTGGIDRNGFILNNVVRGSRSAGIDVHPNAECITIDNNKIYLANKERDLNPLGQYGNHEGLTYQGAHGRITNNEVYGLSGSSTTLNERPGVFIQGLTRQVEDTFVVSGNRVTNIIGAGVIGYFFQNQKYAGDIQSLEISNNHFHGTDYGGAGALSPIGMSIESYYDPSNPTLGTNFYNVKVLDNNVRARSTALRLIVGSTRYMRSASISGNYETINNDAPVIDISAGASNVIERVALVSPNLFGGNFSVRNINAGRVTWSGGTAGGFATAATSGTITQPAGAANEIRS